MTINRAITIAATLALGAGLLGTGVASAKPNAAANAAKGQAKLAQRACNQERKALGTRAFKRIHGKRAMRACKRAARRELAAVARNAAGECRDERATLGDDEFAARYGTNANRRNAFGRCVSSKVADEVEAQVETTRNAARQCRSERAELGPEAFAEQYGTNANRRNAFGKCVSQRAREQGEQPAEDDGEPDGSS